MKYLITTEPKISGGNAIYYEFYKGEFRIWIGGQGYKIIVNPPKLKPYFTSLGDLALYESADVFSILVIGLLYEYMENRKKVI